jgi:hypothetical protein
LANHYQKRVHPPTTTDYREAFRVPTSLQVREMITLVTGKPVLQLRRSFMPKTEAKKRKALAKML